MRSDSLKERQAPYAMLIAGVAIVVGWGLMHQRSVLDAVALLGWLAIAIILGVALMLLGCFVTAKLLGTSFGELRTALLKLAAIFVFPSAIGWLLPPWYSTLVATGLYFALLLWLFDLEVYEAAVFSLVMIAIRWLILLGVSALSHT